VKLDKSFAMAPPESILGRMLPHVLDIIKTSEHLIVVESVETAARLDLLRSTSHIDYIQGYALSRPLSIDDFVAFLSTCGTGNSNRLAA
jgi:EAL domain-containing protein (putative c-di-GMP-specific phosphodiesterase class I)